MIISVKQMNNNLTVRPVVIEFVSYLKLPRCKQKKEKKKKNNEKRKKKKKKIEKRKRSLRNLQKDTCDEAIFSKVTSRPSFLNGLISIG